jgi:hypothetical protein
MDRGTHTDDGAIINRQAVLPVIEQNGARAFMSRIEVEMDVGTTEAPGLVFLDWSDDGGATWNAGRNISTGTLGATRTRVATTRLGSFRQRVLRLRCQGRATFFGVDAEIQPGAA